MHIKTQIYTFVISTKADRFVRRPLGGDASAFLLVLGSKFSPLDTPALLRVMMPFLTPAVGILVV